MKPNSPKVAQPDPKPVAASPGYELPDKLEAHAATILGSEAAKTCEASAKFIREKIVENTDLKAELLRLRRNIQRAQDALNA